MLLWLFSLRVEGTFRSVMQEKPFLGPNWRIANQSGASRTSGAGRERGKRNEREDERNFNFSLSTFA